MKAAPLAPPPPPEVVVVVVVVVGADAHAPILFLFLLLSDTLSLSLSLALFSSKSNVSFSSLFSFFCLSIVCFRVFFCLFFCFFSFFFCFFQIFLTCDDWAAPLRLHFLLTKSRAAEQTHARREEQREKNRDSLNLASSHLLSFLCSSSTEESVSLFSPRVLVVFIIGRAAFSLFRDFVWSAPRLAQKPVRSKIAKTKSAASLFVGRLLNAPK